MTVSRATTAADCGTLPNTATVTADNDTNSTNNSSTASIVVNCPDVSVLKTADATPINAGANASFTIVVTNNGPGSATNVTLTDTLPGTGWTEGSASCSITPGVNDVLNCNFGTLAFPSSASVTVSRATSAADCGTLPNTATVSATGDTNSTNNSSTAQIVVNCPDVSVLKTAVDPSIDAGENATFTVVCVFTTPSCGKVGTLICGENLNPLARFASSLPGGAGACGQLPGAAGRR